MPNDFLNLPVDFDSLVSAGALMGSGGMIVVDETTCMVELARFFLNSLWRNLVGSVPHAGLEEKTPRDS